jgi:hypothetical protein
MSSSYFLLANIPLGIENRTITVIVMSYVSQSFRFSFLQSCLESNTGFVQLRASFPLYTG